MSEVSLEPRDTFADWAHVRSTLVFEGDDRREPMLTIAIPTFRRGDLLCEAVESAAGQVFHRPIEIIVVDNDPNSDNAARLLERFPHLRGMNFRYYVNPENIGMFGNWNRCIELGRGEWHSLLNDDDLLAPRFAAEMFAILDAHREIEGMICRKRPFGDGAPAAGQADGRGRRLVKRLWTELRFRGRGERHFGADKFFWGSPVGNTVGMIARKQDLIDIGGYRPEDYPSADHLMMTRFAMRHRFAEARATLASIRIEENESARPDVLKGFIERNQALRRAMAGTVVPAWWTKRFSALTVARHRAVLARYFGARISDAELQQLSGMSVVKDRKWAYLLACGLLGGL